MGGHVKLIARVTDAELRAMYARHSCPPGQAQNLGFKLSIRSLGRAVQAIAKPATLLKLTEMAARLYAGDPTALKLSADVVLDVRRGMAAKRVMREAESGNPKARAILARARAAAATRGAPVPTVPGVDGGVMRYLVTVQRLARA
jgi:hypothetical protein